MVRTEKFCSPAYTSTSDNRRETAAVKRQSAVKGQEYDNQKAGAYAPAFFCGRYSFSDVV